MTRRTHVARGPRARTYLSALALALTLSAALAVTATAEGVGDLTKAGQVAFKQGRLDQAQASLEKAIAQDASYGPAYYWLGEVYLATGRGTDARWAFATALAKGEQSADAHRGMGDAILLAAGNVDSAGAEYDAALAQKPKMERALLGRGRVLYAKKKYGDAVASFDAGLKKAKSKAAFHAWRGAALAAQGAVLREEINAAAARGDSAGAKAAYEESQPKFKEADIAIRTAIKLDPTNPEWKVALGDMYMARGVSASAVQAYTEANALVQNRNAAYLYKLGQALSKDRSYTPAVEAYRHATEVDSTMAPAYVAMGELFFLGSQYDNAARALQRYVQLQPNDPAAWFMLGESFFRGRHYPESIEPLAKVVQLAPDSCRAGLVLGDAYALYGNTGRFDAEGNLQPWPAAQRDSLYALAQSAYLGSLERCPGQASAEVYVRAGKLSLRKKDYVNAEKFLLEGWKADSTNAELAFQLGLAYFYQLKYDQAIPQFERAVALDDSNSLAYLNLGLSYYGKGRWSEAVGALARADSLLPQDNVAARAQAMMWQGLAYAQLKNFVDAEATLQRALALDPTNAKVKSNLDLVRRLRAGGTKAGGTATAGARTKK